MTETKAPPQGPVLVVMAHPDDPEFACGGTVAAWTRAGTSVSYIVVTDGAKGSGDRQMTSERLVPIREAEQRAAAAELGVNAVHFLGFVDGETRPNLTLRRAIAAEIRRLRPATVVTHDPARLYGDQFVNHPDHRAVGQATLDAIYPTARDHLNQPELLAAGLEPHKVACVLLTGTAAPDYHVDITATLDVKLAALRHHASQIADHDRLAEMLRERHTNLAADLPYALAEAFKRIDLG